MDKIPQTRSLPGLTTLFKESWERFTGSFVNVFVMYVIGFFVYFALAILAIIILVPLGILSFTEFFKTYTLSPTIFTTLGVAGLAIVAIIVILALFGFFLQAVTILFMADYKDHPKFGETFKKGFPLIFPFFGATILMGLLVAGGYFLFVVPGIILAVLFSFVYYELVVGKNSITGALARSVRIVTSHFWGIVGRMLFLSVVLFVLMILISTLQRQNTIFATLSILFQVFAGWFATSYGVTLYIQAEKAAKPGNTKLLWPIIIAVVGWILGILFIGTLVTFAVTAIIPQIQENSKPKKIIRNVVSKQVEKEAIRTIPTLNPTQKANLLKVQNTVNTLQKVQSTYENYKNN